MSTTTDPRALVPVRAIRHGVLALIVPRGYGASWAWVSLVVVPLVLVGFGRLVELRVEHYGAAALLLLLAWAGPRARRFSVIPAPIVLVGLGYELLPFLLPLRGDVHVEDLWRLERMLFPAPGGTSVGDVIAAHPHPVLDLVAGLTYLTYVPQVCAVALWVHLRRDAARTLRIAIGFGLLNIAGWAFWILWPAAPPWYVDQYGLGAAQLDAEASAAGAARFDELIGYPIFTNFYSRTTNVFGAMPSLHAGYAALSASAAWSFGPGTRRGTLAYAICMVFSAVYLRHHYLLDVVVGILLALTVDRLTLVLCPAARSCGGSPAPASEVPHPAAFEPASEPGRPS